MEAQKKIDKFLNEFGSYYKVSMESYGTFSVSPAREHLIRLIAELGYRKLPQDKPLLLSDEAVEEMATGIEVVWVNHGTEAARKCIKEWIKKYVSPDGGIL